MRDKWWEYNALFLPIFAHQRKTHQFIVDLPGLRYLDRFSFSATQQVYCIFTENHPVTVTRKPQNVFNNFHKFIPSPFFLPLKDTACVNCLRQQIDFKAQSAFTLLHLQLSPLALLTLRVTTINPYLIEPYYSIGLARNLLHSIRPRDSLFPVYFNVATFMLMNVW